MSIEVGSKLEGKVTGITHCGAFVELPNGQTGLVHISEIADNYVRDVHDFLNINELEWGETCAAAMRERGFELDDGMHNAVKGARRWAEGLAGDPKVHFCSSVFKDSVQLRERLKRIAANTARPFDEVTDDGTVVYGVLEPEGAVDEFLEELDEDEYAVCEGRIEMAWWVLAEHGAGLPGKKYVVERYPNGGMVVEVTPL